MEHDEDIPCRDCGGVGYHEVPNGPDDIDKVLCDTCEGSGFETVQVWSSENEELDEVDAEIDAEV